MTLLRLRRRLSDEAGISLVEVMVAFTVLALTLAATASTVVTSLQVTTESRATLLASNIAQFELERLRSIPYADWVTSPRSGGGASNGLVGWVEETGPEGIRYFVYREAQFVDREGADASCSAFGGGADADYIRVRQVITFPLDPDSFDPESYTEDELRFPAIENITVVDQRINTSDAATGNLAVVVRDRDGAGIPGIDVQVQGIGGIEFGTTDSGGCAFFPLLEVDIEEPTNNGYDITIDEDGYVDRVTKLQRILFESVVSPQSTTVVEFSYDEAVAIDPVPGVVAPPFGNCTPVLLTGPAVPGNTDDPSAQPRDPETGATVPTRVIECWDDGDPVDETGAIWTPASGEKIWAVSVPQNIGYTVYNSSTDFNALGRVTAYEDLDVTALPDAPPSNPVGELCSIPLADGSGCESRIFFPYVGGYGVHAGRCTDSDPGVDIPRAGAEPGEFAEVDVPLTVVELTTNQTGTAVQGTRDVYADLRQRNNPTDPDDDCVERLYLGRSDGDAELRTLLPVGDWVLHWDNQGNSSMRSETSGLLTPFSCDLVRPEFCTTVAPGTGLLGVAVQRGDRIDD